MKHNFGVIIPGNISPFPSEKEITAAQLLASFFKADVKFVLRSSHKTADFLIEHQYWELKSLTGNGNRTVQHALHRACHQSHNIIIDARFTKMHMNRLRAQLKHELSHMQHIHHLILIHKNEKVIELLR